MWPFNRKKTAILTANTGSDSQHGIRVGELIKKFVAPQINGTDTSVGVRRNDNGYDARPWDKVGVNMGLPKENPYKPRSASQGWF